MDLNTVEAIMRPGCRAEIPAMGQGDAVLAGGTWLFSEPQTDLRRLLDVTSLGWPALERIAEGLRIGATCTLAELEAYEAPESWRAAEVIGQCCRALLGSFKIRKIATVGGNLCLALPAAPMAALIVALDGTCEIWTEDGGERSVPAGRLITGAGRTALRRGEILRAVVLPEAALRRRATLRQMSLTPLGRSAALLIGARDAEAMALTITAAVAHPVRVAFASVPTRAALAAAIEAAVPAWHDDIHGRPAWRRRVTHLLAADIRDELAGS
jgi:CO/xanthine dehydrogenase FAD-binding subunit